MSTIKQIACKDCGSPFYYGAEAEERDRMAGRTPPERCPNCRTFHRKEYSALGCSHVEVLQLRSDGVGGLGRYFRPREEPSFIETQPIEIDSFPIEEIMGDLLHGLRDGPKRVHLVVGPTGSGKSTWLPFRLLTCEELVRRGPICVTQPRIPATEGPSAFVGKLFYGNDVDVPVGPGLMVGYRHGEVGLSKTDAANRLIFMTDGTLLNELISGEAGKYSVVMIDEAHERSVNIDMILSLLRARLPQFPHLHVLIASATVDASSFQDFFGGPEKVARYESKGFTYPILEVFADEAVAHWATSPDGKFLSCWKAIDEETARADWLGPLPCLDYPSLDRYRLRYYPQFETLVFQGVMSQEELHSLGRACEDPGWREATQTLYEKSRRQRRVGPGESIPIIDSIRGSVGEEGHCFPVIVQQSHKDRLAHAMVDAIRELVLRDQEEAPRRLDRWERREAYGWEKLKPPYPYGHILAFLPTTTEIDRCYDLLVKELRSLPGENRLYRFHREAPVLEKEEVARETSRDRPIRKIILGTNLAETSLTLDGLVYVIDTGLICETYYSSKTKTDEYPTILHSQAGCRQRLGRVGRKEPGEGYRLYTRKELKRHPEYTTPEIARSSAEQVLLRFASAGLPPALMQPPPPEEMARAQRELERLQALDADGDVTSRGSELLKIREKRPLVAILLCEADRFGCLWEMAIFLAFLNLPDRLGPEGQGKWLSLWAPGAGGVYEDQRGETAEEEEETVEEKKSEPSKNPWKNPYWKANVLLKQQALRDGVLDDLELYLRVWQGWFSRGDEDRRRLWAAEHGVSHEALKRVERELGLDDETAEERGTLRNFWPFDQKGVLARDVLFESLDKVRYLYAAAVSDQIYKTSSPGEFRPFAAGPSKSSGGKISVHTESVWADHAAWMPSRYGKPAALCGFVATPRVSYKKTTLRHIVWLDPEWLKPSPPSLDENPIALARRFAPSAERHLTYHGRWPFVRGDEWCDLFWPMPAVPVPSPLRIAQWRARFATAIAKKERFRAKVVQGVTWPHFIQRLVFLQLPAGPLLPLELADVGSPPSIGEEMEVELVERKDGLIWAQPPQSQAGPRPAGPSRPVSADEKGAQVPAKESTTPIPLRVLPKEDPPKDRPIRPSLVSPSRPISVDEEGVQAPAKGSPTLPPLRTSLSASASLDLREHFPANSHLNATFSHISKSGDTSWLNVGVTLPDGSKATWGVPIFKNPEQFQAEARPGRSCVIMITRWVEQEGKLKPYLRFVCWKS